MLYLFHYKYIIRNILKKYIQVYIIKMGIPTYFNHIVKRHNNIIKETSYVNSDYLFIDANSLVYDTINELKSKGEEITNTIIFNDVISYISKLIDIIKPSYKTYVCFDGMPPLPKIIQQKQRRFKSNITKQILNQDNKKTWNTNQITPGTDFMCELNEFFTNHYKTNRQVIFSGPNEPMEGEHKIRKIITENEQIFYHKNCIIYGLDADLIMLGLLINLHNTNVFLHKETKYFEYIGNVEKDKYYVFKMNTLSTEIHKIMNTDNYKQSVMDYCFICFLCGNDFMPHLPSISLRNSGIDYLIETYSKLNKKELIDVTQNKINWEYFHKFVFCLKEKEQERIKENLFWKISMQQKVRSYTYEEKLNNLPVMDNDIEKYLIDNIDEYNQLILKNKNIKSICINYLKMLEWNWDYYVGNPVVNDIYYKYSYGPLFSDLLNYIPIFNCERLNTETSNIDPINIYTQLYYVLPFQDHKTIIPKDIYEKTNKFVYRELPNLTKTLYNIDYFLCRYFWESHLETENEDIYKLNNIIKNMI